MYLLAVFKGVTMGSPLSTQPTIRKHLRTWWWFQTIPTDPGLVIPWSVDHAFFMSQKSPK